MPYATLSRATSHGPQTNGFARSSAKSAPSSPCRSGTKLFPKPLTWASSTAISSLATIARCTASRTCRGRQLAATLRHRLVWATFFVQGILQSATGVARANQTIPAIQDRGVLVRFVIRRSSLVPRVAAVMDAKEEILTASIYEPVLAYARLPIGFRQPPRVFPDRCIADDFHDQDGRAFQYAIAGLLPAKLWHQTNPA